jgi:hypothetical protein
MSGILNNVRWRNYKETASDPTPPHSTRFLNHLAAMLDTGARGYSVAVTGATGPQSTEAVVLVSSNSGDACPQGLSGLESVPVQIRSARKEEERAKSAHALQNPVPTPVPQVAMPSDLNAPVNKLAMEEHVVHVLSFLEYAHVSEPNLRAHVVNQLMRWLVFRCWPKIALRVGNSEKEWKKDPVTVMQEGPTITLDVKSSQVLISTPFVANLHRYGLSSDDVDLASGITKYTLTEDTAPAWLKCIGHHVYRLRQLLSPDTPDTSPKPERLRSADRLLRTLREVLQSKAVATLLVDNTYWSTNLKAKSFYSKCSNRPHSDLTDYPSLDAANDLPETGK